MKQIIQDIFVLCSIFLKEDSQIFREGILCPATTTLLQAWYHHVTTTAHNTSFNTKVQVCVLFISWTQVISFLLCTCLEQKKKTVNVK